MDIIRGLRGALAVLCATVGLAGLAGTAAAGATPDDYLYDLRSNGKITGSDQALLDLGRRVCAERADNVPMSTTVGDIYTQTRVANRNDAQFLYDSAVMFLC